MFETFVSLLSGHASYQILLIYKLLKNVNFAVYSIGQTGRTYPVKCNSSRPKGTVPFRTGAGEKI